MKEFKVSEKEINSEMKKRLKVIIPLLSIAAIGGIFIGLSSNSPIYNIYIVLPVSILVSFFAIFIGIRWGMRINYELMASLKLELTDDSITKHQKNVPGIRIEKSEITSITENGNGIIIKTKTPNKYIHIPINIEGYADLKDTLSEWMKIKIVDKNRYQFLLIISTLGTVIGFGLVILSNSPYIVIPAGVLLLLLFIWNIYTIRTNPNMDSNIKRTSWVFFFPVFSILFKIFYIIISQIK